MLRVLLLITVLAATGGVWYLTRPDPIPVSVTTVERGLVTQTVSNTRVGTVKACRRAYLAPAAGGAVSRLNVREGATVRQGDVLLEVWNDNIRAELTLAEAELAASRARVDEVCAASAGAERESRRQQQLATDKLVSEEIADRAATEAASRRAGCAAARAGVEVANARIAAIRTELERTLVLAPFDGYVAEVNAEIGEYVTPSPPGIPTLPAIDLINAGCIYVSAPIDEVDAPEIRLGMPACVDLDAFATKRCSAKVRRIAPYVLEVEKQARTVEVEVEIEDPAEREGLLPGYSADIEIELARRENVVRVPAETVVEGKWVFVFDRASSRLQRRDVTLGLGNWKFVEVTAGLEVGDLVVLSIGAAGVADGVLAVAEAAAGTQQ
ncbi:MAG: efflux RND transporter periplasmic adaptor subunit [Gammaproteobacteria bacterium]|nr:efflux RND transporter periplasmic adaptor subunit [Gammaproteobacteria bacterium]